jgi:signal transduction histidine kinase
VRISTKITLAFAGAGVVLFGGYGAYTMHAERHTLLSAVERETRLIGRSVQVSAENALRDRQLEDIDELIRASARVEPNYEMQVYDHEGRPILTSREPLLRNDAAADDAARTAMTDGGEVLRVDPPGGPRRLLLALPLLSDAGVTTGALIIDRNLADLWGDLRRTRTGVALSVSLFVLTSAILGLVFGTVYIAGPLGRMAAAMQRVRDGDLHPALSIDRRDEMGDLARVFNAMVADLDRVHRQLEAEGESRQRLQQTLQQADKLVTIGQLSAGLAHEIGTPLQILNGRARALLSRADDPAETRRYGQILVAQSERIARIVDQLLRFARQRRVHVSAVDLSATVSEVIDLLQYEARRRGVALTAHCAGPLPPIAADADQLQQVVLNLLTNALHATASGGAVRVDMSSADKLVSGRRVPAVRMCVTDTGSGIAAEHRAHLFEPFFTTRRDDGGTGLGLAVVHAIVSEHGGTIQVESAPGHGSSFRVEFPVAAELATAHGA